MPLSLISLDITEGRNPLGGNNDQCFQVDSDILSNSSVNGKVHIEFFSFLIRLILLATLLNTIAEDWQIQGYFGKRIETELLKEIRICLDHDEKVRSFGRETPFRRTNKASEEVARKYMIMKTLQMKDEGRAGVRDADTFQAMCQNLTSDFVESNSVCLSATCDPALPFRSIDGCCNNLESPKKGISINLMRYK